MSKQADQKSQYDEHAKFRELFLGQSVLLRSIWPGQAWLLRIVIEKNGPLSYFVQRAGDRVRKGHLDHIWEMNDSPCMIGIFTGNSVQ